MVLNSNRYVLFEKPIKVEYNPCLPFQVAFIYMSFFSVNIRVYTYPRRREKKYPKPICTVSAYFNHCKKNKQGCLFLLYSKTTRHGNVFFLPFRFLFLCVCLILKKFVLCLVSCPPFTVN